MKRVFFILVAVLLTASVFLLQQVNAQVIPYMNYQTVIRNAKNVLLVNQPIAVKVTILKNSAAGIPVYIETHTVSTNASGLVSLQIGGGVLAPGSDSFAAITWSAGEYFIKTETDPAGGTDYTVVGTSRLMSAPYALYSAKSASSANALPSGESVGDMNYWNGIAWVPLAVGSPNQRLTLSSSKVPMWSGDGLVKDINDNVYRTVTIGTQTWMIDNYRATSYNNGASIPLLATPASWAAAVSGAYCNYDGDLVGVTTYGRLYNWHAVNSGKLAPVGWHVATDADWTVLANFLGGVAVAGGVLKEAELLHWQSPNTGAINAVGFTALPGGYCDSNQAFAGKGLAGSWWTSSSDASSAWYRSMLSSATSISRFSDFSLTSGLSVRCVKD